MCSAIHRARRGFCSNRITLGSAEHAKSERRVVMIPCVSHITREVKVIALTTCWKSISHTKCLDHAVKQQKSSRRTLGISDIKSLCPTFRIEIPPQVDAINNSF